MGYHQEVARDELSYRVIGVAIEVHSQLGRDLPEKVYRDAFAYGLDKQGFDVDCEREVPVRYRGKQFGTRIVDMVVDEQLVVELKVVQRLTDQHFWQLGTNVRSMNKRRGLLINFGESRIRVRRYANDHGVTDQQ